MKKEKYAGRTFQLELRELLDKKKLTYREFSKKVGVSKTYLTMILVHGVLPSKKLIEDISKALGIKPTFFKEYRIMKFVEKLENYSFALLPKSITRLEKVLNIIVEELPADIKIFNLDKNERVKFTPTPILDLTVLRYTQRKTLNQIYDNYIKENNKRAKWEKECEKEVLSSSKETWSEFINWISTEEGKRDTAPAFSNWKNNTHRKH